MQELTPYIYEDIMETMGQPTQWDIEFYQDAHGRYPVKEWLLRLDEKERARVARTIQLLETNGVRLGAPHTKHLQGKIWELRISSGRRDYRVFYCAASGRQFVLLHAFLKKTPKTPKRELEIAERRLMEHQERSPGEG